MHQALEKVRRGSPSQHRSRFLRHEGSLWQTTCAYWRDHCSSSSTCRENNTDWDITPQFFQKSAYCFPPKKTRYLHVEALQHGRHWPHYHLQPTYHNQISCVIFHSSCDVVSGYVPTTNLTKVVEPLWWQHIQQTMVSFNFSLNKFLFKIPLPINPVEMRKKV